MSEIVKTAYHESGHAVMAFLQNIRIVKVTMIADERLAITGMLVQSNKLGEPSDRKAILNRLEKFILVAMAGMVAEALHSGVDNAIGAAQDIAYVQEILQKLTYNPIEKVLYEKLLWARTKKLLQQPQNGNMIEKLAIYLLEQKTLTGKQVVGFLRSINQEIDKNNIEAIHNSLEQR